MTDIIVNTSQKQKQAFITVRRKTTKDQECKLEKTLIFANPREPR